MNRSPSLALLRHFLAIVCFVCAVCIDALVFASDPQVIAVWPGKAPGEAADAPAESEVTEGGPKMVAGKKIYLLTNVSKPELAIYKPEPANDTGASVIICPGGLTPSESQALSSNIVSQRERQTSNALPRCKTFNVQSA